MGVHGGSGVPPAGTPVSTRGVRPRQQWGLQSPSELPLPSSRPLSRVSRRVGWAPRFPTRLSFRPGRPLRSGSDRVRGGERPSMAGAGRRPGPAPGSACRVHVQAEAGPEPWRAGEARLARGRAGRGPAPGLVLPESPGEVRGRTPPLLRGTGTRTLPWVRHAEGSGDLTIPRPPADGHRTEGWVPPLGTALGAGEGRGCGARLPAPSGECPLCEGPPGCTRAWGVCCVCCSVPVRSLPVCLVPFHWADEETRPATFHRHRDADQSSGSPGTQTQKPEPGRRSSAAARGIT